MNDIKMKDYAGEYQKFGQQLRDIMWASAQDSAENSIRKIIVDSNASFASTRNKGKHELIQSQKELMSKISF